MLGSTQALAEALGLTNAEVLELRLAERVSPDLAVEIEQATEGRVTRHDLRPDLFAHPSIRPAVGGQTPTALAERREVRVQRVTVASRQLDVELTDGSFLVGIETLRLSEIGGSGAFFKVDVTLHAAMAEGPTPKGAA
ncbi:MAG: helix-turn-helix domain-containing protein [Exiguobacterium profundum]|nr:MAG: helix-turn-helix domain-containing protein [Exiguobacterium profundum]